MSEEPTIKTEPKQMMSLLNAASSLTVPDRTEPQAEKPAAGEPRKNGEDKDDAPMSFPQKVSQLRGGQ